MKILSTLVYAFCLLGALRADAQIDTLAGMRRFVKVCDGYQRLPLQLDVNIDRSTNLPLSTADTTGLRASFYLEKAGSYIEMEGVEQLANDSLMLLVNKATKRMIVMANHQSVDARLRQLLSFRGRDSSVYTLAARYSLQETPAAGDTAVIDLKCRALLFHTALPREQITVWYTTTTGEPLEVTRIQRTLVPVSDSIYRQAAGHAEWAGKTVSVHDSSFYLVKEQQTIFRYSRIAHDPAAGLPVSIGDRLVADEPGKYRPVSRFSDFVVSGQY